MDPHSGKEHFDPSSLTNDELFEVIAKAANRPEDERKQSLGE